MPKPLAIDIFCGLGGWAEGFLAEGYDVIGFDIERHVYGAHRYPAQLVMQDVLTLHGSQFRDATVIVASPPCQKFSYMAMPWSLAKAKAAAIRADETGAMLADLTRLFDACFRIQREACEAAGQHIPLIVENVRGAVPWVGPARWNFGSYYLFGDVPALMPITLGRSRFKVIAGEQWNINRRNFTGTIGWDTDSLKNEGTKQHGSGAAWFDNALNERRKEATAIKNSNDWFGSGSDCSLQRRHGSKSTARKAASAMIAKIPLPLSRHIARTFKPDNRADGDLFA
jgi:hypothetical protein